MAPKIASRQLAYAPPPVPNFLQKLHSQVNQSRGNINDKRGRRGDDEGPTSEFDDLLGIGSSSKSASKVRDGKEEVQGGSDEEDEWDGAQIVVLKEGRHLSKEEAAGVNKDRKEEETMPEVGLADGIVAVPQAAPASSSAAKRTKAAASDETESNGLDEVKNLIRSSKGGSENESEETIKKRKKEEKEKIKEEKNKRAKIEKSKRGKGLSFSMDD